MWHLSQGQAQDPEEGPSEGVWRTVWPRGGIAHPGRRGPQRGSRPLGLGLAVWGIVCNPPFRQHPLPLATSQMKG